VREARAPAAGAATVQQALRAAWATVRFEADEARAAAGIIIRGRGRSGRSGHRNECDRFQAERQERAGARLVGQ
jgi:hypothetical protein